MTKPTKWVLGALVVLVIVQGFIIGAGRRALYDARLAAANERAAGDRTRNRLVGQVLVAERLARQARVDLGDAQRRPGLAPQAAVGVAIVGKKVTVTVAATAAIDTATLVIESTFDGRDSLGVSVAIHSEVHGVAAVGPRTSWTRFDVAREPLTLTTSLSCEARPGAAADAVMQVSGPRWASIDVLAPQVAPGVCNPRPPAWRPFQIQAPSLPVAGGLVLVGWVLHDILTKR